MINMAAGSDVEDARTKPVVIYQMTWSAGGDALVVKGNVKSAKELKGKAVAVQAYGPHVDYSRRSWPTPGLDEGCHGQVGGRHHRTEQVAGRGAAARAASMPRW